MLKPHPSALWASVGLLKTMPLAVRLAGKLCQVRALRLMELVNVVQRVVPARLVSAFLMRMA